MKHFSSTSWLLLAFVLLCGCGGYQAGRGYQGSTGGGGGGTTPPPPSGPNIAGNWEFSTNSTSGMPPATIAGAINQSGTSVTGAVHVQSSKCFDRLTTIGLTGTLTGSDISLTSASVGGQVLTLDGSISPIDNTFTGTYTINGGCGQMCFAAGVVCMPQLQNRGASPTTVMGRSAVRSSTVICTTICPAARARNVVVACPWRVATVGGST